MANLDGYQGNNNLKRINTDIEYTEDHAVELARCIRDPVYFIKTYVKIVNVDKGLVPFEMWPFQEEMVDSFHKNRFTIAKMPRQVGKCLDINTPIKIRNKSTGEILECTIGELYEQQNV